MLVTTIPTALDHGMSLLHHARVDKLLFDKDRVAGLVAVALNADTRHTSGTRITVRARHYILSGGAINTPALLRSEEHTSELQSLMRISYAVFCLKTNKQ